MIEKHEYLWIIRPWQSYACKGKREQIVKVNITNIGYPNEHTDIILLTILIDHAMILKTLKLAVNLDIKSTKDKRRSIVNKVMFVEPWSRKRS